MPLKTLNPLKPLKPLFALFPLLTILLSPALGWGKTFSNSEGEFFPQEDLLTLEVTTAPFLVDKRYKSMEGPIQTARATPEQILKLGSGLFLQVPASETARNIESGVEDLLDIPNATALGRQGGNPTTAFEEIGPKKELLWFLGAEIEVLDPKEDKILSQEYLCHFNIDVSPEARKSHFPSSPGTNARLITLTSGATSLALPRGFGVPITNKEPFRITFQVLNHNFDPTKGPFEVRQRVKMYFVKDTQLKKPFKPLAFDFPFIAVPFQKGEAWSAQPKNCPCCAEVTSAKNAPQNVGFGYYTGDDGKKYTGHWVIPTGPSTYKFPVRYFPGAGKEFAKYDTTLHASIPHVHPYTTSLNIIKHDPQCQTSKVFHEHNIINRTDGKVGMIKADVFSSEEGIPIKASDDYELVLTHNNTSGEPQDAMGSMALYTLDKNWTRPAWADPPKGPKISQELETCSIPVAQSQPNDKMLVITTHGTMLVELLPEHAPKHVEQVKKLAQAGCYNNLEIFRIEPKFVAQVSPVEQREGGLSDFQKSLIENIPLEANNNITHSRGILSMARWPDKPNSAQSSFSFHLGEAPHLDGQYTIFGQVVEGLEVLNAIEKYKQVAQDRALPQKKVLIKEIRVLPRE